MSIEIVEGVNVLNEYMYCVTCGKLIKEGFLCLDIDVLTFDEEKAVICDFCFENFDKTEGQV